MIRQLIWEAVMDTLLEEGVTDSLRFPSYEVGLKYLKKRYGDRAGDFDYIGGGIFKYNPKKKKKPAQPRLKPKGRMDGETYDQYLDRVRRENPKFAQSEDIEGEEWRPLKNSGRYFSGVADFTKAYEISNMGRIRVIDFADPMRSKVSTGYAAPTKGARQMTIKTSSENGQKMRTTPPIHTMVADTFLEPPAGDMSKYYVRHKDGNPDNNRADNLEYVLRKDARGRKNRNEPSPEETPRSDEARLRGIVRECVWRALGDIL